MKWDLVFRDSRIRTSGILGLIWLLDIWHFKTLNTFLYPLLAVFIVTFLDVAITKVRSKVYYLPASSFVSGLLIGLIIGPASPIWIIALAAVIASFSKQFIKAGVRRHIFNPAALGIMAVSLAFGVPVAWWSVAWSKWTVLILVLSILVLWKLKRLYLPLTFLIVFFLYLLIRLGPTASFTTLIDGSVGLFAFIMLPEPITSPAWGYFKYLFGGIIAVLAIGLSYVGLSEVFLPALLLGNLLAFLIFWAKTASKAKSSN